MDVPNTEGADVAAGLPNNPPPPGGAEVVAVFCAAASGVVEDTASSVGDVTVFPGRRYSLCSVSLSVNRPFLCMYLPRVHLN